MEPAKLIVDTNKLRWQYFIYVFLFVQAEIDKQKRVEGERARQAAEDKRKDK